MLKGEVLYYDSSSIHCSFRSHSRCVISIKPTFAPPLGLYIRIDLTAILVSCCVASAAVWDIRAVFSLHSFVVARFLE